jgi:hypothetical protein
VLSHNGQWESVAISPLRATEHQIAQVPSNLFIIVHLNFPTSPTKGSYLVNSQIQHASPQSKTMAMGVSATSCS